MLKRKRKLGRWQIDTLMKISKQEVCCHRSVLDILGGSAKNWSRKYNKRLNSAIWAHNNKLATNSPIDINLLIEEDPRKGFKLTPRD